jgi:hypothetical protein
MIEEVEERQFDLQVWEARRSKDRVGSSHESTGNLASLHIYK